MANKEQLDILKQGVEVWNKWRADNPDVQIDLMKANLFKADLSGVDFSNTNLNYSRLLGADLSGANITDAMLIIAILNDSDLSGADLSGAALNGADLSDADLSGANLSNADLSDVRLISTDLTNADLSGADLIDAFFSSACLSDTDLSGAILSGTIFVNVDLSTAKGLEIVEHQAPSTIGIDTIVSSQGKIPEFFLRGTGFPPSIIEAIPSIIGSLQPIDFYSCFISYSSRDQDFAERLHADLQAKGVRCWLDKENLKIGEKFRPRIDEAIRRHDKLLLVLSQHSVKSSWVETEVETAFEKERRYKKLVLFPIRLDEAVMRTRQAWAADIERQRHVGDFTGWKDHDIYQKSFTRLLRDLKSEENSQNEALDNALS